MNNLQELQVVPSDVVVSNFGVYQHWSIVSDQRCELGMPMLISANQRQGTVKEESWNTVTQGKKTYVAKVEHALSSLEMLRLARSQINIWKYSLTSRNCEHFVKWVTNVEVSSKQVVAGVSGGIVGAALVGALVEKPNMVKFLGGALLLGGLAIYATKAKQKVVE